MTTTPSGHTYVEPTTVDEIRERCTTWAQAIVEGWDEAELPPPPTWAMIGTLLRAGEQPSLSRTFLDRAIMWYFETEIDVEIDESWCDPDTDMIMRERLPEEHREWYDTAQEKVLPLVDTLLGHLVSRLR